MNCNLFKVSIKTYLKNSLFHIYDNDVHMYELWHNRCHVNYESMKVMGRNDIIPMCGFDKHKCFTCMLNKITRNRFRKVERSSNILNLMHSDLCDFHSTSSLGKKKDMITFIDDYFRFCYVYLLHSKDEALSMFKIFKNEVEVQLDSKIKRLRTDRGSLENIITLVIFKKWESLMKLRWVIHHNQMVLPKGKLGHYNKWLTPCYLLSAYHILNRVPTRGKKAIPSELWYKRKPNLNYLRVWGCRAIVRVRGNKRKKLGERGFDCIFVGYAHHSHAYRFYVIEPYD